MLSARGTFTKINRIPGLQASFNQFQKLKSCSRFSDHHGLGVTKKEKIARKIPKMCQK